ncbi:olfactory receptor 13G1-like [Acanthopagrus latus]|uniref:olfactory receptor 13G1-like n=1 Tax=Acanthopagrus latus TaxID=8177 RepID=UPI00187C4CD6|nr:olfactory receptor 13G1-like [Acanthopagrus latus]
MPSHNTSIELTAFVLGGFETTQRPFIVGVSILFLFIVAVLANMVNIVIIAYDKKLHKPMFLLISNLAVVDILCTTSISPTMIGTLLAGVNTISYVPCVVEMYIMHVGGVMEMFALAVMAFDRLIAVSCPFQYHSYLTNLRTILLVYMLWIAACCFVAVMPATVLPLSHCHTKLIYSFCDYAAIMRTTCADLGYYFNMITIISFFLLFFTFSLIALSYFFIAYFVKLSTSEEKRKMGSTCLSHLIVVVCFYLPMFMRIVLSRMGVPLTAEQRHGLTIWSHLGPPSVNPFVYSLRTKEIRQRVWSIFKRFDIS